MLEGGKGKKTTKHVGRFFPGRTSHPHLSSCSQGEKLLSHRINAIYWDMDLLHMEANAPHDRKFCCCGPGNLLSPRWGGSLSQSNQVLYELPS